MSDSLTNILIRKRTIEINILTHLQNYKRTLQTANAIGANVLRELNVHREQLDEIDGDLKTIKADLDESGDHINSFSSIFNAVTSFFIHHEKKESVEDTDEKESPADPDGFESTVNREMHEIIFLLNGLRGEADEINREMCEHNDLIDEETAESEKLRIQFEKGIAECDKLLKK